MSRTPSMPNASGAASSSSSAANINLSHSSSAKQKSASTFTASTSTINLIDDDEDDFLHTPPKHYPTSIDTKLASTIHSKTPSAVSKLQPPITSHSSQSMRPMPLPLHSSTTTTDSHSIAHANKRTDEVKPSTSPTTVADKDPPQLASADSAASSASASAPTGVTRLNIQEAIARSSVLASFSSSLLPFHKEIIRSLSNQDGLVVLGRGLGIQHVWMGFLSQYLQFLPSAVTDQQQMLMDATASAATVLVPPPSFVCPYLIFLLNFDDMMLLWMNEMFQTHHVHDAAKQPEAHDQQQMRSRGIRIINNEYSSAERQRLYRQGGIYAITSRILIVDLLDSVISSELISGFCVHDAHQVNDTSLEAFILRIWRKKNKVGWIKAMSEDAASFTRRSSSNNSGGRSAASFYGLETIMKALFLRKVWLYPRFTISVSDSLKPPQREVDPDNEEDDGAADTSFEERQSQQSQYGLSIEEFHQPFSENMISIQNYLIQVIDTLITQLKTENKHLTVYDGPALGSSTPISIVNKSDAQTSRTIQALNLSIEAGLMANFDSLLRSELDPIEHKLSRRTRSLMADLKELRHCIFLLIHSDCVAFYHHLQGIKSKSLLNHYDSTWLLSESADKLFKSAKQRIFTVQQGASYYSNAPTVKKPSTSSKNAKKETSKSGNSKADAMELSDDEENVTKVHSKTESSSFADPLASVTSSGDDALHLVLEENPKWALLLDTIEEIEQQVCERTTQIEHQAREKELNQIMKGENTPVASASVKVEPGTETPAMPSTPLQFPPSFGRTLIIVRDSRVASFLTHFLTIGGRNLLKIYWKKFLFRQNLHKRNFASMPTGTGAASSSSTPVAASSLSTSAQYTQFQRETILLKRELDSILDAENYSRFLDAQEYRAQRQKEKEEEDTKKRLQQQEEESEGFDVAEDPKLMTLTQLSKKQAAEQAEKVEARKKKRQEEKEAAAARAEAAHKTSSKRGAESSSVAMKRKKIRLNDGVGGVVEMENLDDDDDIDEAHQTNRDGDAEAGEDSRQPNIEDEDEAAFQSMLDHDEKMEEPSSIAISAIPDNVAAAIAAHRAAGPSTAPTLLFDRPNFSVIDGDFKMNQVVQPQPLVQPSPFFPVQHSAAPSTTGTAATSTPTEPTTSAAAFSSTTTVNVLPSFQLMIHPFENLSATLHHYAPEYVIIYDPDISVIRALEVFQSLSTTTWQVKVSFLLYANSIEELRYVTSIEQENKAFDSLIQIKKNMVIPIEQDGKLPEIIQRGPTAEEKKNASLYEDGVRNAAYEAYAATLPKAGDTRRGGVQAEGLGTILVDVREFRSPLPSMLHAAGFTIVPITLEIADFVLTPTLAIERKSVPDLLGSFASGHLFNQMTQAIRYYKTPVLLIEFDRRKPFHLIALTDMPAEIQQKNVMSQLVLLILHFPQMRIVWSRDMHATTNIFTALKQNQQQPTVEQAVTATTNSIKSMQAGYEFIDLSAGVGLTEDEKEEKNLSLTPHDILRKLPGVTVNNIRSILQNVNNLRELCECSLQQLTKWMANSVSAKKLYTFLHDEP